MIYRPKGIDKLGDTWMFFQKDTYYLYYESMRAVKGYWRGYGVSLATSSDGVHWKEIGLVLAMAKDALWLGSGAVWKSPSFSSNGKFIMNFSEWRGPSLGEGQQTIFFAESTDLVHWNRLGSEYVFKADPQLYKNSLSRWDNIHAIPRPQGGLYGYWKANPTAGYSAFAFGESLDGVHWTALTAPRIEWGKVPVMPKIEVGGVEKLGDKYYAILGRCKDYMGPGGGMFQFVADDPKGPFRPVKKNYRLLTTGSAMKKASSNTHRPVTKTTQECSMTYDVGFFPIPDMMLMNHFSITRSHHTYFPPLKRAIVDKEGILRLGYWEGNESLKGDPIKISIPDYPQKKRMAMLDKVFDLQEGIVLEGILIAPSSRKLNQDLDTVGFHIEENAQQGSAILIHSSGITDFGSVNADGSGFSRDDRVDRQIEMDGKHKFRLLLRHTLLEFYLDGILIQCYSLPVETTGRIGLILGSETRGFENFRAYRMSVN